MHGLVITKRDFCFETKTRPSLPYKVLETRSRLSHSVLETRPRLLHSRLESRARPLSNELELTRDPRLWSRGHKSGIYRFRSGKHPLVVAGIPPRMYSCYLQRSPDSCDELRSRSDDTLLEFTQQPRTEKSRHPG